MNKVTSKHIKEVAVKLGLTETNSLSLERIGKDLLEGKPLLSVCWNVTDESFLRKNVNFIYSACKVTTIKIPDVHCFPGDKEYGLLRWCPFRNSKSPDTVYLAIDWIIFAICFREAIQYDGLAYGDYPEELFDGINVARLRAISLDLKILGGLLKPDTADDKK